MMNLSIMEILCSFAAVFLAIYYYTTSTYNFWKNRGIPGPRPLPAVGNFKDIMLAKVSFAEFLKTIYDEYQSAPFIGIFVRRQPVLLVSDPDLLKDIFIKDFPKFANRGMTVHEKIEPLSVHLFNLEAKRWRTLRSKLSPVFTSGKLKQMFYLLLECANHFEKYFSELVEKGEPIDCREVTAKFATDVIGCCAFGLHMNAMADKDSEFRKMGRKIFKVTWRNRILIIMREAMPWLYNRLGKSAMDNEVTEFFLSTMKQTMDHRRKNNIVRHDFVDLLMELKDNPEKTDFELTHSLLTAQAFVFFVAGFETSSTTMSHALYELAQNHEIQDKVREEIKETLKNNDWKLTYEIIKEMNYLHMVFQETLRKHPPVPFHLRQAVVDYTFSGTNLTVQKGQKVWVPLYGIHHDAKYYPKPEVFDPERFTEEACKLRHPMTYMPFGDGPRNCIGARFAVYQTKVGLIKILLNNKVDVCEKTTIPYRIEPKAFLLAPVGGIHLQFHKIE